MHTGLGLILVSMTWWQCRGTGGTASTGVLLERLVQRGKMFDRRVFVLNSARKGGRIEPQIGPQPG